MDALANPKAIANELAIINDPATAREQPVLVDLVGRLHAARSVKDLLALHTKLLARYLARQRARGELELDKTRVESEMESWPHRLPGPSMTYALDKRNCSGLRQPRAYRWHSQRTRGRSPTGWFGRPWATTERRLRSSAAGRASIA
jgi:hypothetical protein